MKRFILVSLFSCLLVGQINCDWRENVSNFCKGAGKATAELVHVGTGNWLSFAMLASAVGTALGIYDPWTPKPAIIPQALRAGIVFGTFFSSAIVGLGATLDATQNIHSLYTASRTEQPQDGEQQQDSDSKSYISGRLAANASALGTLGYAAYKLKQLAK